MMNYRDKKDKRFGHKWGPSSVARAEILVGRRSDPDQEKCGPESVICLAPDQ